MTGSYLDKVYQARDALETRDLYDGWASSYDAEMDENGYATPMRCAAALARFTEHLVTPILDFGCGTGRSGQALRLAGFETIDGADLSMEMLQVAAERRVYRQLFHIGPEERPVSSPGAYSAIAAIGVIGAGAAPIETLDMLMESLGREGLLVLSLNDHSLADPANEGRINEWTSSGRARQLFHEYGDHLPGLGLRSSVFVLEKT